VEIRRLMAIANKAKSVGGRDDMLLANVVFAVILDMHLSSQDLACQDEMTDLEYQTQDSVGRDHGQPYYDIIRIVGWYESTGQVFDTVCIPVPLLSRFSALSALKAATLLEPEENVSSDNSQWYEPRGESYRFGEMNGLWMELFHYFSPSDLSILAESHLDDKVYSHGGKSKVTFMAKDRLRWNHYLRR